MKYALRSLAKKPGFALAVALTLALGLGLNVTVLTLLDALLLRPFQVPNHDRIVILRDAPRGSTQGEPLAPAHFLDLQRETKTLQRLVAWEVWDANAATDDTPEPVAGARVSAEFFHAFGAPPAHGRAFSADEEQPGNDRRVVISHRFWQHSFAANPAAVGMQLQLDGQSYIIVGIAPERFSFPAAADVWAPLALPPERARDRTHRRLHVAGELAPGRSLADARAELQLLTRHLEQAHPAAHRDRELLVQSLTTAYREHGVGPLMALLQVGAGFVLVVAAANIAGLLLARAVDRRHEFALRAALGASRGQIVRLIVTETVVLGLAASALAALFASGAIDFMRASMPADMARHIEGWENLRPSGAVVALMPVLAIGVGLLVGLPPALFASRAALGESVRSGSRAIAGGHRRQRTRRVLVVIEIASALVLVIVAALVFAGGRRLMTQSGGFDSRNLLTVDVRLPRHIHETAAEKRNLAARMLDEVGRLPGVQTAACASVLPAAGWSPEATLTIEGQPLSPSAQQPRAGHRIVSPAYFETLRISLRGRGFTSLDHASSQLVAVVSASLAERHWPGENPIGRRLRLEPFGERWLTVVGIAADTRMFNWWDGEENPRAVYVPLQQHAFGGSFQLAIRTLNEPAPLAGSVRNALASLDPLLAVRVRTMDQAIENCGLGLHYLASLLAVCGSVALVLALIGIYSLMAYEVSQRTHEFGVRMALGATPANLLRMTLRQAGRITFAGLAAGAAVAFALAELLASALVGLVSPSVPLFLAASAALGIVSLLAAWLPARHATKTDPVVALRAE